ncbi:MAG: hypothetical protein KME03_10350 [Aphanocapsa lilacina HA4352-LM1]|jgi:hypothetical protein|nr:hypothetical protein [Aphanocapsa lilacina HA4352-LM1]
MEGRLDRAEGRLDQHGELIAELRAATLTSTQNLDQAAINDYILRRDREGGNGQAE